MRVFQFRYILLSLLLALLVVSSINAQPAKFTQEEQTDYQNRQRMIRLAQMRFRIANLEDAPMRCFLNIAIVRFITGIKTKDNLGVAESAAVDCLQDIEKNADQFGEAKGISEKSSILGMLKKSFPELAEKLEAKYGSQQVTNAKDFNEVELGGDLTGLAARISARILNGDLADIPILYARIKLKSPTAANVILEAVMNYFERTPDLSKAAGTIRMMGPYFLEPSAPVSLRVRFCRFIINLAEHQLLFPESSSSNPDVSLLLESSLADIDHLLPLESARAKSIFLALNSRKSQRDREYLEITRRIAASDDRLAQTISEAEAATDRPVEMSLWFSASNIALEQKKFKVAVDCRLKYEPKSGPESLQDYFLLYEVVEAALAAKDVPSADYAIKPIKIVTYRAEAELKVAAKFVELADPSAATERLDHSLNLLNRLEPTSDKVRIMSAAIPVALKIQKAKAFDIARDTIRVANRLQLEGADKKQGTPERTKFATGSLLWNAYNLSAVFRTLAKADFQLASALEDETQSKPWRLAVEIVIESQRPYRLPETP